MPLPPDGSVKTVEGAFIEGDDAEALRLGKFRRVEVMLVNY